MENKQGKIEENGITYPPISVETKIAIMEFFKKTSLPRMAQAQKEAIKSNPIQMKEKDG